MEGIWDLRQEAAVLLELAILLPLFLLQAGSVGILDHMHRTPHIANSQLKPVQIVNGFTI